MKNIYAVFDLNGMRLIATSFSMSCAWQLARSVNPRWAHEDAEHYDERIKDAVQLTSVMALNGEGVVNA